MARSSARRRTYTKLGLAVAALAVAAAAVSFTHPGKEPKDASLGTVKREDLTQQVTVAGTVNPRKRTVITPPYSGYVKKMYVQIGDEVKAGAPVVSIVPSLVADAGETFPIRAPLSGRVVQVLKSDGEYVEEKSENSVMVRIDDLSSLYILTDVPEIDMVKMKLGQEAVIKASAIPERAYKGVVREISIAAKEKKDWQRNEKVEYPVRIEITDKDERIRPGMSALVDIIAAKRPNVLTLRHEFIRKSGKKYFVLMTDGTRRDIEVGLQNEEAFEIIKGLKEGDRVRKIDFLNEETGSQPEEANGSS